MKSDLGVVVITKNGRDRLGNCLKSASFADELIVIDNQSKDGSAEVAKRHKAKVIFSGEKYFDAIRNAALNELKTSWVLYLDDDEEISSGLKQKIQNIIGGKQANKHSSFKIYRKNIMLGKWLKHGGWWPDPMHRLFKVTALKGWRGKVHEHPVTKGTVGQIKEPIIHRSKNSISEMVKNSIIFGSIEAELWLASGHSPVKTRHYLTGLARIIWGLGIKKKAWRDGQVGMILMIYQVIHQWMVLTMLWEKQSRLGRK